MARRGKRRPAAPAATPAPPPPAPALAPAWVGYGLLAVALTFNAIALFPEVRVERVPSSDLAFHLAASERLRASLAAGEPFLEPWVSEWSLGYPVWLSYQPLPHLAAAGALAAFRNVPPDAVFAAFYYGVVVLLPLSVFAGARLLGMTPAAAGLASVLFLAPSAPPWGRYGLGYESVAWQGLGLYTQAVALHALAFALGGTARALDGRWRAAPAAALLAVTVLSHVIFGYVAFVSAAVLALVGPGATRRARLERLAPVVGLALLLVAWFVVPLALNLDIVNHSRWEAQEKWDSYGARQVLGAIASGSMFDGGRGPWLTCLVAAGLAGALAARRETVAQRLLALAGVWLALFWGRATWGALVILFGVPNDLHMHRLQAAFELSAILLAAYGITRLVDLLALKSRPLAWAAAAAVIAAIAFVGIERARFLRASAEMGDVQLASHARALPELDAALADVRAILAERPGRAFAGRAAGWGKDFRVGYIPVYAYLTRAHIDQASFLFHAMSKTSDIMVLRNDASIIQDTAFGVRAVIAPTGQAVPPEYRVRGIHGPFAVYEASPEGYFAVVDVAGHYVGAADTFHEASVEWLRSPLPRRGLVVSLDRRARVGPAVAAGALMPVPQRETPRPGVVVSERKDGETYSARVRLDRPGYAEIKITWARGLEATVDGAAAELLHVTPGFGAVAVPAGEHEVVVRYRPGPLKPALLVLGLAAFAWAAWRARALGTGAPSR
jgi:hypothetical protein